MVEFFVLGGIAVLAYILYARVIAVKNAAREAASGIDVQLQKRRDLIPNVLTIAKKYMEHETSLLEELTALRATAERSGDDVGEKIKTDAQMSTALGNFFAVAENYPDLKADGPMMRAQETYEEVEAQISAARRFYNSAVTDLNNACETFPHSIFASMVGAKPLPWFEATEAARAPVNASDHL